MEFDGFNTLPSAGLRLPDCETDFLRLNDELNDDDEFPEIFNESFGHGGPVLTGATIASLEPLPMFPFLPESKPEDPFTKAIPDSQTLFGADFSSQSMDVHALPPLPMMSLLQPSSSGLLSGQKRDRRSGTPSEYDFEKSSNLEPPKKRRCVGSGIQSHAPANAAAPTSTSVPNPETVFSLPLPMMRPREGRPVAGAPPVPVAVPVVFSSVRKRKKPKTAEPEPEPDPVQGHVPPPVPVVSYFRTFDVEDSEYPFPAVPGVEFLRFPPSCSSRFPPIPRFFRRFDRLRIPPPIRPVGAPPRFDGLANWPEYCVDEAVSAGVFWGSKTCVRARLRGQRNLSIHRVEKCTMTNGCALYALTARKATGKKKKTYAFEILAPFALNSNELQRSFRMDVRAVVMRRKTDKSHCVVTPNHWIDVRSIRLPEKPPRVEVEVLPDATYSSSRNSVVVSSLITELEIPLGRKALLIVEVSFKIRGILYRFPIVMRLTAGREGEGRSGKDGPVVYRTGSGSVEFSVYT